MKRSDREYVDEMVYRVRVYEVRLVEEAERRTREDDGREHKLGKDRSLPLLPLLSPSL